MDPIEALRHHLTRLLSWHDAHADFDAAVADLAPEGRGVAPPGLPYSPWQLVEHIRLTQADILAFCARSDYREGTWPDDYWPSHSGTAERRRLGHQHRRLPPGPRCPAGDDQRPEL